MKKIIVTIFIAILSSSVFAQTIPSITGTYCPATPLDQSTRSGKISSNYFDYCVNDSDAADCSVYDDSSSLASPVFHDIQVVQINTYSESSSINPQFMAHLESINTLTIMNRTVDLENLDLDSNDFATLECIYQSNQLVLEDMYLSISNGRYNNRALASHKNSQLSISQDLDFVSNGNSTEGSGPLQLVYTPSNIKTFQIDFNNLSISSTDTESSYTNDMLQNDATLKVIQSGVVTESFRFDFEASCQSESECDSDECFGPFDLRKGDDVVGDIKLCISGTTIRKNVEDADGTLSKEVVQ